MADEWADITGVWFADWGLVRRRLSDGTPVVYQLAIRLEQAVTVRVGSLGKAQLPAGWYVYSGSARRAAAARIARHLRKRKPARWHIDHLLARRAARVEAIRVWPWRPGLECAVNRESLAGRDARPAAGRDKTFGKGRKGV